MPLTLRALLAGAIAGALVASVLTLWGCGPEERRALTMADCVAKMALALPDRDLPRNPAEVTTEDLLLAVQVVEGVRACRHPSGDAGP